MQKHVINRQNFKGNVNYTLSYMLHTNYKFWTKIIISWHDFNLKTKLNVRCMQQEVCINNYPNSNTRVMELQGKIEIMWPLDHMRCFRIFGKLGFCLKVWIPRDPRCSIQDSRTHLLSSSIYKNNEWLSTFGLSKWHCSAGPFFFLFFFFFFC